MKLFSTKCTSAGEGKGGDFGEELIGPGLFLSSASLPETFHKKSTEKFTGLKNTHAPSLSHIFDLMHVGILFILDFKIGEGWGCN